MAGRAGIAGGHYRWVVCVLVFLATTVNYIDRQVLAAVESEIRKELFPDSAVENPDRAVVEDAKTRMG